MFATSASLIVLSLITNNSILVITPPFSGLTEAYAHYYFTNAPQMHIDPRNDWPERHWIGMARSRVSGVDTFHADLRHLKEDSMFLHVQYRFIFPNRTYKDSEWFLKVWNQAKLQDYFNTSAWWIIVATFGFVCLLSIIICMCFRKHYSMVNEK